MDKTAYTLAWVQIPRPIPTCKEAITSSELGDSTREHPIDPQAMGALRWDEHGHCCRTCLDRCQRACGSVSGFWVACARVCGPVSVSALVCASWLALCVQPSGLKRQTQPLAEKKVHLVVQGTPWTKVGGLGDSWYGGEGVGNSSGGGRVRRRQRLG